MSHCLLRPRLQEEVEAQLRERPKLSIMVRMFPPATSVVEPSKKELWSFPAWSHGCFGVFFVRGQRKRRSSALCDVLSANCNDDR